MKQNADICFYVINGEISRGTGLVSATEWLDLKKEISNNSWSGYGNVTNAERNKIIAQVNILKEQYEEKIRTFFTERNIENEKQFSEKVRQHEEKKEWVYALHYHGQISKVDSKFIDDMTVAYENSKKEFLAKYMDLETNGSAYAKINLNLSDSSQGGTKYNELKSLIESGKPGYGTFDDFSLHDEWKNLLVNAEKFYSEYPPIKISLEKLSKESVDMKKRTFVYKTKIYTGVENTILDVIKTGLKKARTADWTDIPKDWPQTSVLYDYTDKISSYDGEYIYKSRPSLLIKEVPLFEMYSDWQILANNLRESIKNGERQYDKMPEYDIYSKAQKAGFRSGLDELKSNFNADTAKMQKLGADKVVVKNLTPACFVEQEKQQKRRLYTIKINLVGENGEVLMKGSEAVIGNDVIYRFTDVSPEIGQLIESGKAKISVDSITLHYGSVNALKLAQEGKTSNADDGTMYFKDNAFDGKGESKNLKQIKIDLGKIAISVR